MSETINRDHSEECEEKIEKTCNTKVLTTEYDDDDLLQSYTDQLTINEVSEGKDLFPLILHCLYADHYLIELNHHHTL